MTTDAVLWASASGLLDSFALAAWTALTVFCLCDRRLVARAPIAILCVMTTGVTMAAGWSHLSGIQTAWNATTVASAGWAITPTLAAMATVLGVRRWASVNPTQVSAESAIQKLDRKANRRSKKSAAKRPSKATLATLQDVSASEIRLGRLCVLGLCITAVAMALVIRPADSGALSAVALGGMLHKLAAAGLWGIAIAVAMQTTLVSSPDSLAPSQGARVKWSLLARVALVLFIIELLVASLLLATTLNSQDTLLQVAPKALAITLAVATFVVWRVPHKIAQLQSQAKLDSATVPWTSLTIAAWFAAVSMAMVCALPSAWPWQLLE